MAALEIRRNPQQEFRPRPMRLFIDGTEAGEIWAGKIVQIPVAAGTYRVGIAWGRRPRESELLTLSEAEVARLECGVEVATQDGCLMFPLAGFFLRENYLFIRRIQS